VTTAKRWHVVAGGGKTAERHVRIWGEDGDPFEDERIFTVSLDPNEEGWCTDSGFDGYGLTKALAQELADAANAAWLKKAR
jgi:hypothetical protein